MNRQASDVPLQQIKPQFTLQSRSDFGLKCFANEERKWERCPDENSQLVISDFEELAVKGMKSVQVSLGSPFCRRRQTAAVGFGLLADLVTRSGEVHLPG